MKKILKITIFAIALVVLESCDSGFDELNTSKTRATSLDPSLVLNNAILGSSPSTSLNYEQAIVQQLFSSNTGVLEGGNFNKINVGNTPLNWNRFYPAVIKYTADVIKNTKDDATRANLYNMARIIQAAAFMVLTDTYGDIPYSEAAKGLNGNFFPAYELQSEIYPKLVAELEEATDALDPAGKIETTDALYSGNIVKWKKFGYSLLLRAGMHLSKANASLAQNTVAAAFAGGVILTNADNAIIKHDGSNTNPLTNPLNGTEAANFYLGEPFVNFLKNTSDPRLGAIAIRYVGAKSGSDQAAQIASGTGDKDPANQFGMPVGSTDGAADIAAATAFGAGNNRYSFTQLDRSRIGKTTAPMHMVTAAQNNLLLAEAAFRGWVPGGAVQAATYFNNGIAEHMRQMADYDPASAITETQISDYLAIPANQLTTGTELQQIGEQYWIASLLHGYESWANFRRTGFPALTPNPFVGEADVAGKFIERITYPPNEKTVNKQNALNAVQVQCNCSDDLLSTKIWLFK